MHAGSIRPAAPPVGAPTTIGRPARRIILIVTAIVAVAVVSTALALLGSRGPTTYPPGSPEAAFQSYLVAWEGHDYEATYAAFAPAVREDVTIADYRAMVAGWGDGSGSRRIVLEEARVNGDHATLDLRIDYRADGGLFGSSTWSQDVSIVMVRQDGAWLINQPLIGVEPQPWWKY